MQSAKAYYLGLLGIEVWRLRTAKPEQITSRLQTPAKAKWLFILEEQEQDLNSPLLLAILAAIGQTSQTVSFAFYGTHLVLPDLPHLSCVVVMGRGMAQDLRLVVPKAVNLIESDNLRTLAENKESKRRLWQQLKLYRE